MGFSKVPVFLCHSVFQLWNRIMVRSWSSPHRPAGNLYFASKETHPHPRKRHEEYVTLHLQTTCLELQASLTEGQRINLEAPEYNLTELQLWMTTNTMRLFWLIYLFQISSTCFGRCFRPSSGALYSIYSFWYCPPILLPTGVMDEMDKIRSCKYSQVLLMIGEDIPPNM